MSESSKLVVEPGLLGRAGPLLRGLGLDGRAFVVSNETILPLHGDRLVRSLEGAGYEPAALAVADAEASKSLTVAADLYRWLASERAERRDFVVALGGGVVGDLAGFVAATYLRGLALVQVPTTLLSQVDSAIGGKAGVNLDEAKNLVGAWHMPRATLVDPSVLTTLPRRQIVGGWTETIKHALIMDGALLGIVEVNVDGLLSLEPELTADVVERSARLKVGVVEEDPREQGRRVILNYGHTIGHALEAATAYERFLHGEAVAIGMTGAARLGREVGVTPAALEERQRELLVRFGLPTAAPGVDPARVRAAMKLDKKVEARTQRWVLLEDVAKTVVRRDVPDELASAVVSDLLA